MDQKEKTYIEVWTAEDEATYRHYIRKNVA